MRAGGGPPVQTGSAFEKTYTQRAGTAALPGIGRDAPGHPAGLVVRLERGSVAVAAGCAAAGARQPDRRLDPGAATRLAAAATRRRGRGGLRAAVRSLSRLLVAWCVHALVLRAGMRRPRSTGH